MSMRVEPRVDISSSSVTVEDGLSARYCLRIIETIRPERQSGRRVLKISS